MALNDPYGLLASGVPPDIAAQMMGLTREQAVAQALAQQSQSPLSAPDTKGRFQGRVSPMSAIAKVIEAYMAKQGLDANDQKMADLAGKVTTRKAQAFRDYQDMRDGAPAQSLPEPVAKDEEGNAMPAAMKDAVPGNPRAAVAAALQNPMLANSPLIAADLKKIEPNWAVHKSYDAAGRETQVLVNLNNPSETKAFGGSKSYEPKAIQTTDAKGNPVTKFAVPDPNAAPLPAPVEQKYENAGGTIEPVAKFVNPNEPAKPIVKTISPDARLSDARQRQLNGILDGSSPVSDLGPLVDSIGNHDVKLPPPPMNARNPASLNRYSQLVAEVKQKYPEWNAPDYDAAQAGLKQFTYGKNGNTVRSLSVLQEHGGTLRDAVSALNNNDNQLFNRVANTVAEKTGGTAPTNFDAVKNIYKDELVKAILGSGGALGDRESADKTLARVNSPAQLLGVMDQYDKLMAGQLHGLRRQYEQTTKRKDFDRFLSERAKEVGNATAAGANSELFSAADAILGGKP